MGRGEKYVKSAWRLEPEGETEVPEIIVVSDAVESIHVDLDCKKPPRAAKSKKF